MENVTYHKAQIVPYDPDTVVFWWEDNEGRCGDILKEDIPHEAEIIEHD